ncbi:TonB-dependent receptor [Psychrosphaera haliotis]|uniref:TonB-dependent receptor n=1 Tax=Psychrosphaera haliotis TaxID=555083 RepID=UPI0031E001D9
MKNVIKHSALALAVTAALGTATVNAAETSTAVRGTIQTVAGQSVNNATITFLHVPSGSVKEVTVNEEGAYRARGLRVGGPYMVTIASEGFQGKVYENVYLELNDILDLSAKLETSSSIEKITVTGSANFFANSGSSSIFTSDDIAKAATVSRDLKDIVRSNPLAVVDASGTQLSVAGSNPKYNSLTVDGVGVNDTFGLNSNGYPAQRPPVSLNAVDQVSIEFAPFNARASNFSGGTVNVVTKSGTNDLSGSFFFEKTPFNGDAVDEKSFDRESGEFRTGEDTPTFSKDDLKNDEVTFGAALGGALIEDELFFFASYEEWEKDVPTNFNPTTLAGHNLTTSQVQSVIDTLQDTYGISDSIGAAPAPDSDKKLLVKLDWNINDDHRADISYSKQENTAARNYINNNSTVNLTSNGWSQDSETEILTGHLFSDWSADFSTEFNFAYKDFVQASNTNSNLGEINVRFGDDSVVAGQDESRHGNELANETLSFGLHGLYLVGDLEYKFGAEVDNVENYNLYARHAAGTWTFSSLENFQNKAPSSVSYENAFSNDMQDLAFSVESTKFSLYGEVNTEIMDDVILTAGLRYERLTVKDEPTLNQNYLNEYGISNQENLDGLDILLPRLSIEWTVSDDLIVRGGVGRFSGGMPLVWVSNAYTNDGVTLISAPSSVKNAVVADPSQVMFDQVPQALQDSLVPGNGNTNTIDKDFEQPSDWRYQVSADYTFDIPVLGNDFQWFTEFTFVTKDNAPYWIDEARVDSGERIGERIVFENRWDDVDRYDLQLTNIDNGGYSRILTTALNKKWDNGVSLNMSYTNQNVDEVNPGTSSTATSNFQYEVTTNRNNPEMGRAYYEIEHRFVLNLGYETELFEGYETSFNLFYERKSGRPFSWTLGLFEDRDFGDQSKFYKAGTYLPELPSGPDDANFDFSRLSYEDTYALMEAAGVTQYAGGTIPKYTHNQPWTTNMDLAITQELPGFAEGHKGQLYFIIDNLANLLNDDWGKIYNMSFPQQVLFDLETNGSQYQLRNRYKGVDTNNYNNFEAEQSSWSMKVGVKYSF